MFRTNGLGTTEYGTGLPALGKMSTAKAIVLKKMKGMRKR
jgi:hypothetical protein